MGSIFSGAVWQYLNDAGEPISAGPFIYRLAIDQQAKNRVI